MASQTDKTEIMEREAMKEPTDVQSQVTDLQIDSGDQRYQDRDHAADEELHIEQPLEKGAIGGFLVIDPSVRRRNPTDRGLQYQLDV